MTHKDILEEAGTISHEKALKKAHKEYDKYIKSHLTQKLSRRFNFNNIKGQRNQLGFLCRGLINGSCCCNDTHFYNCFFAICSGKKATIMTKS